MRTALSTIEALRPRSLADALRLLDGSGPAPRPIPIAGGTDLFVTLNAGTLTDAKRFLDLTPLRELRGVRAAASGLRIGALTTFWQLREHPVVRRRWPALATASAEVGAWANQQRATIGGNVANASPAGDSLPVLLAYDAVIVVRSRAGERKIPFAELYRGYRSLAMEPGELITAVLLPAPPARAFSFFRKVGTRRAQSISKVVLGAALRRGRDGRFDHVRLAFGSVAPTPLRARNAEAALLGAKPGARAAGAAVAALASDLSPIDDIRSDREYRTNVAGRLVEQLLRAQSRS